MELKNSCFKLIFNLKQKMIPLQMGDKMVFDNTILLWGIKHSENGYELKDIFPTSSFNDYPIFIGNKKICFTHFIVIKFFFLKKKK